MNYMSALNQPADASVIMKDCRSPGVSPVHHFVFKLRICAGYNCVCISGSRIGSNWRITKRKRHRAKRLFEPRSDVGMVTGDGTSESSPGCSGSACGTLTNVGTFSVTYVAPSTLPSPATVTLTAYQKPATPAPLPRISWLPQAR